MKLTIRAGMLLSITLLMVFGLELAPVKTAQAQGDQCFGLSADDCALLKSANPPFKGKLSSFNMDYELTLTASGMRSGGNVDVSVKGSGPFEFDRTGAGVDGLMGMDATKIAAVLDKLTMANTITYSFKGANRDMSGNFEFRILNGVLYFQGDKATNGKWMSIDLKQAAARRMAGGFPGLGGLGNMRGGNPFAMLQGMAAAHKLLNTPGFIKIERTADTTVENQQIATFVYHFDLPTLFNSPDFATVMQDMMSQAPNAPKLTDAQIQAMGAMMSKAFKNTTFTITRMVGVTDKLPHGLGLDLVLNVNPSDFAGMMMMGQGMMAATPEANPQPINVNFHFLIKLTGIGTKANVTAPTDATPLNLGGAEAAPTMEATAAQ